MAEMTFDEITAARIALFEKGGITLVTDKTKGRMVPNGPESRADADEYNRLAKLHAGMC